VFTLDLRSGPRSGASRRPHFPPRSIWLNLGYVLVRGALACGLLAASVASFRSGGDKEKGSPFECGFDHAGIRRLPFCIKFFLIRIIFLVFDVEVALILPLVYAATQAMTFLIVLLAGLLYEWSYGGLQ